MRAAVASLALTDFRSYDRAELSTGGRSVYLFGPNGAGKTNLLEALSLLSPGRGMRAASLGDFGRRLPGEARLGTGVEAPGAARRLVRIEGEAVPPGRLAEHLRPLWLTPAQDRLFLEGAAERRRVFDRLVFGAAAIHPRH